MPKKLLFLTTHNLATNPRLVKEIELALQNKFQVQVICFEFNNWSKKLNDQLLLRFNSANFIILPADRKPFFLWLTSVIKEISFRSLSKFLTLGLSKTSQAVSRRSLLLLIAIKKVHYADLVIGHNPGAIYPTLVAAKKFNCPSGFDVEDYHPGEGDDKHLQKITLSLMQKLMPKFDYVSFASNLIQKKVEVDLEVKNKNWFSILNYFPSDEFIEPSTNSEGVIRFVWFSQNINQGRGLEEFLSLFEQLENVELHLYGNLHQDFYNQTLSGFKNIIIHQTITQSELHREIANYDIGLALDIANDANRDLAVTNKILAYLQSGLFVLASNISAHEYIVKQHEGLGVCLTDSNNNNFLLLQSLLSDIVTIRKNKNNRFYYFKEYCWETESVTLNNKWNELLN